MPQVGQDLTSATIIEWKKQLNDTVEKGEVVAVVESDKASFDVEAQESGVLIKVLYEEGDDAPVLGPIAYLGQPGEIVETRCASDNTTTKGRTTESARTRQGETRTEGDQVLTDQHESTDRIFSSPHARRLARERGIDLRCVKGTGPKGRIVERDVPDAQEQKSTAVEASPVSTSAVAPAPEDGDTVVPFSRMRQRIADRLTLSQQTIPHFYLSVDVDMTAAVGWRKTFNQNRDHDAGVTVTDLIIKASATALVKFSRINAHVGADKMILKAAINIGVATAVDEGLLVPVIARADRKSLTEISAQVKLNTKAAQRGMLKTTDVGTFTVSSLGMYGINRFLPIINPVECAILAVGAIQQRAVPTHDGIGVREMMSLTLAADHRAVDGREAAGFLNAIKEMLKNIDRNIEELL